MPKNTSRVAAADKTATLLRIYRAAVRSGDRSLRDVTASELRYYGVDVSLFDSVDLENSTPPASSNGGAS
jgi:hypothetical protein